MADPPAAGEVGVCDVDSSRFVASPGAHALLRAPDGHTTAQPLSRSVRACIHGLSSTGGGAYLRLALTPTRGPAPAWRLLASEGAATEVECVRRAALPELRLGPDSDPIVAEIVVFAR